LQFSNANIKIELLKKRNELEQYRLRTRTSYIVLGLGILASFILVWALINQIIKNRQEKEISQLNIEREKQQHQLLEKQLEEQRTQALLEEERYKHEIELRDKELMSKAMIVANRNDIVTNIVEELSKSQYFKETNNTVLKQTVSQLQRAIDNNEAWQDFSTYFEQRNDAFIAALREKHPELKANDIRFLSLIYINLSTKEIATLLNITPEYCKKKRQQLAKKMGFENTKALFTYLSTLT
jgi:DNA-binding CsgD family transcriptional regulator